MAGNSPLKATKKERIHIIIPRYLEEQVRKSAEDTNRSMSQMVTELLMRTYGRDDPYLEKD